MRGLWPELSMHFGVRPPDLHRYSLAEIESYVAAVKALRKSRG